MAMNQHFVPRVYLKNFAEKRGSEYYVDVYDKTTDKVFNTNITNICAERDLYTLDEESTLSADKLVIEKFYAIGFEPMYDRIFKLLTDDTIFDLTDLQRIEILLSIFQLYMRNPRVLRISMEHHTTAIRTLVWHAKKKDKKGITYIEEDYSFREYSEDEIIADVKEKVTKHFKEGHVTGIGELGDFHEFSKLEVTKNKATALYFTSDNPLALEDMVNKEGTHPMEKSKEFVIALNPQYSLRIYHDNTIGLNTIIRPIVPNGDTASRNLTIFNQASRFVIGNKRAFDEFFQIRKLLEDPTFERKVDLMKQVVAKFDNGSETNEMTELLKNYLAIYDRNGSLTYDEEQAFNHELQRQTINWKQSRLS
jgi:hypothetical protein